MFAVQVVEGKPPEAEGTHGQGVEVSWQCGMWLFSHSVLSNSSRPHGLQHARLPCPSVQFSSVQSLSRVWLFVTPWTAACQATRSITNSWSLAKLIHWVGDAIQPPHPLLCPSPPALNLSQHQGLFQWVSSSHQVAKVLEFQLQHPGLIFHRMDWLALLAVQGTLKSLIQQDNSKASILWCSAFFIVQLSHPYMTTGKTIALTRWNLLTK